MPRLAHRHPPRLLQGLLAVLSLGMLAIVLWHDRAAIRELTTRRPDLGLLALALLITQANLLLTFGRWTMLVRVVDPRIPVRTGFLLGFLGYFFNLVIPGAVGGDLIKAACLSRMDVRRTQAIASMVMDRVLGLLGLLALAALAGLCVWSQAVGSVQRLILAAFTLLGGGVLFVAILFVGGPFWERALRMSSVPARLSTILTELRAMSRAYRDRPGTIVLGFLVSMVSHGLTVLVFYALGMALFGPRLGTSLGQHFLMAPLTLLTTAIPLPFGAIGVGEEVSSQLFGMVGHPSGAIVLMSVRVLMLACGLECAVVYLFTFHEVRRMIHP